MFKRNTCCSNGLVTASLRMAIGGVIGTAMLTVLAWQTRAGTGEWSTFSAQNGVIPTKTLKVSRQPRPSSAPTGGYDGYAIAFTGTIEPAASSLRLRIASNQPRPSSAP